MHAFNARSANDYFDFQFGHLKTQFLEFSFNNQYNLNIMKLGE